MEKVPFFLLLLIIINSLPPFPFPSFPFLSFFSLTSLLGVGFWATGARYAGEWLDNVPHGLGVWLSPDRKTKKSGKWAYGRYEENTKDEKGVGGVGRKAKKKAKKAMVTAQSAQISGCYARAKILLFRYGLLKDGGWLRGDNSLSGVAIAKKKVVPGSMMFLLEVERGVEWERYEDFFFNFCF